MTARFAMKVHKNYGGSKVVAVSDYDLLGRTLEDKKKNLEITISKVFYGEQEFRIEDVLQFIKHTDNVNLIGNDIVDLAIKEKLIDERSVITIAGIKHAQIYSV